VSGQLHAPVALPPGKEPLVSIGQEAGWTPEPFWTRWWREKFPAPAGNRTLEPRLASPKPSAIPTELSRLTRAGIIPRLNCVDLYWWWWWGNNNDFSPLDLPTRPPPSPLHDTGHKIWESPEGIQVLIAGACSFCPQLRAQLPDRI
jgi:hypothetical protein